MAEALAALENKLAIAQEEAAKRKDLDTKEALERATSAASMEAAMKERLAASVASLEEARQQQNATLQRYDEAQTELSLLRQQLEVCPTPSQKPLPPFPQGGSRHSNAFPSSALPTRLLTKISPSR